MNVDAFCGAGGASVAMASLGLDPIGLDIDADSCATHAAAGHRTVRADLATYPWRGTADVLHASPPCQPFSASGNNAGHADPRDGMPHALRAVYRLRPRLVTVENVRGLTYRKHAAYLAWFTGRLADAGYEVDWRVLNAADYGVPQTRQRLIVVARRDGVAPQWPDPTHAKDGAGGLTPWRSMAEALGWGMTAKPFGTVACSNTTGGFDPWGLGGSGARRAIVAERDEGRWVAGFPRRVDSKGPSITLDGVEYRARDMFPVEGPSQAVTEKGRGWSRWQLSTRRDQRPDGSTQTRDVDEPSPAVTTIPGQWIWDRPATTVNGDPRISRPGHHAEDESGSQQRGAVRVELCELAALQGFPPDYPFQGTRTSRARQIGNAVPPALLAAVLGANL